MKDITELVMAPGAGFEPAVGWLHEALEFPQGVDYLIVLEGRRALVEFIAGLLTS